MSISLSDSYFNTYNLFSGECYREWSIVDAAILMARVSSPWQRDHGYSLQWQRQQKVTAPSGRDIRILEIIDGVADGRYVRQPAILKAVAIAQQFMADHPGRKCIIYLSHLNRLVRPFPDSPEKLATLIPKLAILASYNVPFVFRYPLTLPEPATRRISQRAAIDYKREHFPDSLRGRPAGRWDDLITLCFVVPKLGWYSFRTIADDLNKAGYRTQANEHWTHKQVTRLLDRLMPYKSLL